MIEKCLVLSLNNVSQPSRQICLYKNLATTEVNPQALLAPYELKSLRSKRSFKQLL